MRLFVMPADPAEVTLPLSWEARLREALASGDGAEIARAASQATALPAWFGDVHLVLAEDDPATAELWSGWASGSGRPAPASDSEQAALREQLAEARRRLLALGTELEDSAQATSPSRKSQVEARCADRIREIASYLDMPDVPLADATATPDGDPWADGIEEDVL